MVNLQSLLRIMAVIAGPMVGYLIGRDFGGWGFGILFAVLGLPLAVALVETPYWMVDRLERRRLTSATSEELRAFLQDDYRHFGRLNILREFRRRGEKIDFELPRLVRFLASPSPVDRCVGRAALREFFPSVGDRLADYNPFPEDAPHSPIVAELLHEICPSP
jgi:hypothetical protein